MTFEEIIWDVLEIKGAIDDDSDLEEMWILHKINRYRAVHVEAEYRRNNEIDPVWLQRVPKFDFTKVTAADDPAVIYSSIELGKATIPSVIKLPYDQGLYRVSGIAGVTQFEPIDFNTLMMRLDVGEERNGEYGYYSRIGNNIYISPYLMQGSAIIIADNPLDVQILENGVFRDMTFSDNYPLDPILAQRAIIDLLTKDLAIAEGAITDIINDSQSELKIMKDEGLVSGNRK